MRETVERVTDDLTGQVSYGTGQITRVDGMIGEETFSIDLGRQAAGALRAALIDHDVSKLRKLLTSGKTRPVASTTASQETTPKRRVRGGGDHSSAYAKRWKGITSRGLASKELIAEWKAAGSPIVE